MSISYRKYLQTTRKNKSKINTPDYVAFLEAEVKKKTNESELKTKQNQLDLLVKRKYLYDKAEINTPDYIKKQN